jgi:ketosteroid isomerase-like protein
MRRSRRRFLPWTAAVCVLAAATGCETFNGKSYFVGSSPGFLASSQCQAAPYGSRSEVAVEVRDEAGIVVPGMKIRFTRVNPEISAESTTDANGVASAALDAGSWRIDASMTDFRPGRYSLEVASDQACSVKFQIWHVPRVEFGVGASSETPKSAESSRPAESTKPAQSPKSPEASKAPGSSKPAEITRPAPERSAAADKVLVEAALRRYSDLALAMDHAGIAALFAPEGEIVNRGQPPVHGPAAIEAFLSGFVGYKVLNNSTLPSSTLVAGDRAFQQGSYRQRVRKPDGGVIEVSGLFQAEWVRAAASGQWLILRMATTPAP